MGSLRVRDSLLLVLRKQVTRERRPQWGTHHAKKLQAASRSGGQPQVTGSKNQSPSSYSHRKRIPSATRMDSEMDSSPVKTPDEKAVPAPDYSLAETLNRGPSQAVLKP